MLINPQEIRKFDFSPYGRFLSVPGTGAPSLSTGYSLCWSNEYTLPMGQMRFGFEQATYRPELKITAMEQHKESKEIVICGEKPVVISLCLPRDRKDPKEQPRARDVVSLILRPGDVIVLDEYIWHTGCMPLYADTFYLFAYRVRDEAIDWVSLEDGAIELKLPQGGQQNGRA